MPFINLYKSRILIVALLFSTSSFAAQDQSVWLLATSSIAGTTHTKTLFFHSDKVLSLQECKEEIQRGYINQWHHYNPPSARALAVGESLRFKCVYGRDKPQRWNRSAPYSYTYLVQINNNALNLVPQPSLAKCMSNAGSGHDGFCTASNQKVSF